MNAIIETFHVLRARAEEYNVWREAALARLLADLAPRVEKLGQKFYPGCGFHYSKVQELGKLIGALALPVEFSMNHQSRWDDYSTKMILDKVIFESLVEDIEKAELNCGCINATGPFH